MEPLPLGCRIAAIHERGQFRIRYSAAQFVKFDLIVEERSLEPVPDFLKSAQVRSAVEKSHD